MEYEFTALTLLLVVLAGFAAGFINILAGGGGLLTLPALMLLGMPADVANGTMRVSVLAQSLEAVRGFDRHGRLDRGAVLPMLVPTIAGALIGALLAVWTPVEVLKYVLLSAMLGMALLMLLVPNMVAAPVGSRALLLRESPGGTAALFACGIYGGMVQGGVGFLLIATLAGVLRYDIVRTNALKMAATGVFGAVSLAVFWWAGLVVWIPAIVLALATIAGAYAGVRYALKIDPKLMRWLLFVTVVVVCLAAAAPARAADSAPACASREASNPDGRPVVALVLSGGGARGAAHVGVLRVIEEYGIPVDMVVGTSMGSIIGALYASGWPVADIEKIVTDTDWNAVLDDGPPYVNYSTVRKREMRTYSLGGRLGVGLDGVKLASGFRAGQNIGLMLRDLTQHVTDIGCFRDLAVPFAAVATDAETGEKVVLEHGDLATALRASMALPMYFSPVEIDGRLLVDGGVADNMPVSVARDMGADIVIAVDIGTPMASREQLRSMFSISQQMSVMLARRGADRERESLHADDVLLVPDLGEIKTLDFSEMPAAIQAGEQEARLELLNFPQRDRLSAGPSTAERFAARLADTRKPAYIGRIHVEGDAIVPEEQVLNRLGLIEGDRLYSAKLERAITRVYGLDYYSTIDYRREPRGDGSDDLVLVPVGRTTGPSYAQFGLGVYDNFEGVNEFVLGVSLATTELNRLTGQLLVQLQLGAEQVLHAELYQPMVGSGHLFVAPWLLSRRHNLDLYLANDPVARYRVDTDSVGFDLGWAHRTGEWRIGFGRGVHQLERLIGITAFPDFRSDLGYLHLRAEFDNQDRRDFPRSGIRAELDAAFGSESLGATDQYDNGHLTAEIAGSAGKQTWVFALHGASQHADGDMALAPVTLGGPLFMSAFSRDALVGEQAAMVRLGTYRQFNRLKWLQAYVGGSLEFGGAWQGNTGDMTGDDLWPVAAAYLGMATPLGPLMLIGGISEHGRRALQFQLGYRF